MPTKKPSLTKPVWFKVAMIEVDPIDFKPYKTQLEPQNLFVEIQMEVMDQTLGKDTNDHNVKMTIVSEQGLTAVLSKVADAIYDMHQERIESMRTGIRKNKK